MTRSRVWLVCDRRLNPAVVGDSLLRANSPATEAEARRILCGLMGWRRCPDGLRLLPTLEVRP